MAGKKSLNKRMFTKSRDDITTSQAVGKARSKEKDCPAEDDDDDSAAPAEEFTRPCSRNSNLEDDGNENTGETEQVDKLAPRKRQYDDDSGEEDPSPPFSDVANAIEFRRMKDEIRMLSHNNNKMKRIIKKKQYDQQDGEFVVRKLVAMQKTTLIKYVKNQIFPNVKSVCNELLYHKPAIIEKCFLHLNVKCTSAQQSLRDDVCGLIKYSLCQKRKYVKERLRMVCIGTSSISFTLRTSRWHTMSNTASLAL